MTQDVTLYVKWAEELTADDVDISTNNLQKEADEKDRLI